MSDKLQVAVLARFGRDAILERVAAAEGVEAITVDDAEALVRAIPEADILAMTNPSPRDGARIAEALRAPDSRVRWIQSMSAGFDALLEQPLPDGLQVTGQGGAMAPPVAEHAIAMLLGLSRGMFAIAGRTRERNWSRDFTPPLMALEGRTAVIVGFGSIGKAVARRLRAFDMRVLAVSRSAPGPDEADAFVPLARLHEALGQADAVIATIALAPETRGMFDAAAFAACKPGARFINVARGELVDQAALRAALAAGTLAGAAVDVTSPEPLPPDDPLWDAPGLLVSPHVGGAGSPLAAGRIAAVFGDNLQLYRAGEPLTGRLR